MKTIITLTSIVLLPAMYSCNKPQKEEFVDIVFDVTTSRVQTTCYTIAGGAGETGYGYLFDIYSGNNKLITTADYVVEHDHTKKIDGRTSTNNSPDELYFSTNKQYRYEAYLFCRCIDSASQNSTCADTRLLLTSGYFTPSKNESENIINVDLN